MRTFYITLIFFLFSVLVSCSHSHHADVELVADSKDKKEIDYWHNRALEADNFNDAIKYALEEKNYSHATRHFYEEARAMQLLFNLYFSHGQNVNAFHIANQGCDIADSVDDPLMKAHCFNSLGLISSRMKNFSIASRNYYNAFTIFIEHKDTANLSAVWRNMVRSYYQSNMFDSAYSTLNRCIYLDEQLHNHECLMIDTALLGGIELAKYRCNSVYRDYNSLIKAHDYYVMSVEKNKNFSNSYVEELSTLGLFEVYYNMSLIDSISPKRKIDLQDSCLMFYDKAMHWVHILEDHDLQRRFDILGVHIYLDRNNFAQAHRMVDSLRRESRKNGASFLNAEIYGRAQSLLSEYEGDHKNALDFLRRAEDYMHTYNSSSDELNLTLSLARGQHEGEVNRNKAMAKMLEAKARTRAIMMVVSLIIIVLLTIIGIMLFRSARRAKIVNAQIKTYNEEILASNEEITAKNQEIFDSINYASMIQIAAMPSIAEMNQIFGENLVLLKPHSVVSGDFYWASEIGAYKLLVTGDCTGHGVPGALLSMLGMSILDYTTRHFGQGEISAGMVLDRMRTYFKRTLNQSTFRTDKAVDSIDLALVIVDVEKKQLHYAAAFRPLILFREGQLTKFKADPMPIGVYPKEREHFTNHVIDLQPNDIFYMFSDGITDQTGYETAESPIARAFTLKRFMSLLNDIYTMPFHAQKIRLVSAIDSWKAAKSEAQHPCEQTDDMVVIGISANNFLFNQDA